MFLREPTAKQVDQESHPKPGNKPDHSHSEEARESGRSRPSAFSTRRKLTSPPSSSEPRAQTADRYLRLHEESQPRRALPAPKPSTSSPSSIRKRLSKSQKDQNVKVFFKSLKKSTTLESVVSALSQFGQLKYVRLPFSKTKKRNMGYGYAIYEDASDAIGLLRTSKQVLVDGKPVAISSFSFAKSTSSQRIHAPFCFDQSATSEDSQLVDRGRTESIKPGLHAVKPTCSDFYLFRASLTRLADSRNLRFSICIEGRTKAEDINKQ